MKNKNILDDLLTFYMNYLHALEIKKQFGDIYGDTDELINMYEKKLENINIIKIKKKN